MPVLDLIETFASSEYTGSSTDHIVIGTTLTSSTSGFYRRDIGTKTGFFGSNFDRQNLTHSNRFRYVSSSFAGANVQNLFVQTITDGEIYIDSLLPNPIGIAQTNGVTFVSLENSGNLPGSQVHGNLATPLEAVNLFLSDQTSFPAGFGSPILNEVVDFDWTIAKWPFRSKYKRVPKIFKLSTDLPTPVLLTKNFNNGSTLSTPIRTGKLGGIFYVTDKIVSTQFPSIQVGISSSTAGFQLRFIETQSSASMNVSTGQNSHYLSAIAASTSPSGTAPNTVYLACGGGTSQPVYSSFIWKSSDGNIWQDITPPAARASTQTQGFLGVAHSVRDNNPDWHQAWVVVGFGGKIYVRQGKDPDSTGWTTHNTTSTFRLNGVAYGDPQGLGGASQKFFACGYNDVGPSFGGRIVGISGSHGTGSWAIQSGFTTFTNAFFNCIYFHVNTSRWLVGGSGGIIRSNNNSGNNGWTQVLTLPATSWFINAITSNLSNVCIAVGENNVGSGIIYRSTDGGASWSSISTPPSTFAISDVFPGRNDDNFNWVAVANNRILVSRDNGLTWTNSPGPVTNPQGFDPDTVFKVFRKGVGSAINGDTNTLVDTPQYVFLGLTDSLRRNMILRTTDFVSFTNSQSLSRTISEGSVLGPGRVKAGFTNSTVEAVGNTLEDFYRVYFGYGDGVTLPFNLDEPKIHGPSPSYTIDPFNTTYLRKKSPDFLDYTIYNPGSSQRNVAIEAIRVHAPVLRSWGYGIYNGIPTNTKAIFRRNRYGQFRDMLEQRTYSKFLSSGRRRSILESAVKISFVSGSIAYERARDYVTASNPSYNPTDSGQFDYEYKSGQPFFDNINLELFR